MWQGMAHATTQDAKARAMQKLQQWSISDMNSFELQFRQGFVANGIALREELRRPLGPLPEVGPGEEGMPSALDGQIDAWSIKVTAGYLEWLSEKLP